MTSASPLKSNAPAEHVVGEPSDVPEGGHLVVSIGGRKIGIFRVHGQLYGLPNICPHQTGPLCEGKKLTGTTVSRRETGWKVEWAFEGETIACPWHGLEFNVPSGRCLTYPEIRLRRYDVMERRGEIVVLL